MLTIAERIPPSKELRERLAENLKERDLLRKLIRVAEQAERIPSKPAEGRRDG